MTRRHQKAALFSVSSETMEDQDNLSIRQLKRLERQKKKITSQTGLFQQTPETVKKTVRIKPITQKQDEYLCALERFEQVVVTGPAGVGKTYMVVSYAAKLYAEGKVDKIILARPTESTGKSIGFLPGTAMEKLEYWLAEPISILKKQLGNAVYDIALKNGDIEMQPLEMIRGRSFSNAFIIATECQNTTIELMQAIVTRTGENSKLVLDGDIRQTDLKGTSGLAWALNTIKQSKGLQELTGIVEFDIDDVVRSGLCKEWVKAIY